MNDKLLLEYYRSKNKEVENLLSHFYDNGKMFFITENGVQFEYFDKDEFLIWNRKRKLSKIK